MTHPIARQTVPAARTLWLALALCGASWTATGCADGADPNACDGGLASGGWQAGPAASGTLLAVVGTDYQTTEVSVVDLDTLAVRSAAFLHSGSRVTCSGAALGGDVVLARRSGGEGSFWLIDRGGGVLTQVGGPGVIRQFAVAKGFVGNPQDVLLDDAGRMWLSRAQADSAAGTVQGDDVVQLDPSDGTVRKRVALSEHASLPGAWAWPGRMAYADGQLYVPLASVAHDFSAAGAGSVARIDAQTATVVAVQAAAKSKNCTAAAAAGGRVAAVCSGFFKEPEGKRSAWSNIIRLPGEATAAAEVVTQADDTGQARGFGFELALADDGRGWVISDGDLQTGVPDALWQFDLKGGGVVKVTSASGAFAMTSLWLDRERQRLWVTDRGAQGGDLLVFDVAGHGLAKPLATVDSNPGGLRAAEIGGF